MSCGAAAERVPSVPRGLPGAGLRTAAPRLWALRLPGPSSALTQDDSRPGAGGPWEPGAPQVLSCARPSRCGGAHGGRRQLPWRERRKGGDLAQDLRVLCAFLQSSV